MTTPWREIRARRITRGPHDGIGWCPTCWHLARITGEPRRRAFLLAFRHRWQRGNFKGSGPADLIRDALTGAAP